jgi:hypothetical protein
MKAVVVPALLFCTAGVGALAAQDAVPADPSGARAVWRAAPSKPAEVRSRTLSAPRPTPRATATDELRTLGNLKVLDLREGEAVLRVAGVERTVRPGMLLEHDVVQSITPERMVLVRPERVDQKKGETVIVVDFLGAGRSRVRTYAARDWTAQPPRPAE